MTKNKKILSIIGSIIVGVIVGMWVANELSNVFVGIIIGYHIMIFWIVIEYLIWQKKEMELKAYDMERRLNNHANNIRKLHQILKSTQHQLTKLKGNNKKGKIVK